jgi:hypothetical protein
MPRYPKICYGERRTSRRRIARALVNSEQGGARAASSSGEAALPMKVTCLEKRCRLMDPWSDFCRAALLTMM